MTLSEIDRQIANDAESRAGSACVQDRGILSRTSRTSLKVPSCALKGTIDKNSH